MIEKDVRDKQVDPGMTPANGASNAKQIAARIVQRDQRRIFWLTVLTGSLWMLTGSFVILIAYSYQYWITPKLRAYAEGLQDVPTAATLLVAVGDVGARLVIVCVIGQLLAVVSTIALIQASRRATLRQINSSLAEISEQLKMMSGTSS